MLIYTQSDTVNSVLLLTINHCRNAVWGNVPQAHQWQGASDCLVGVPKILRGGGLRRKIREFSKGAETGVWSETSHRTHRE